MESLSRRPPSCGEVLEVSSQRTSKRNHRVFLPARPCFGDAFHCMVKFPPPIHVHIFHSASGCAFQRGLLRIRMVLFFVFYPVIQTRIPCQKHKETSFLFPEGVSLSYEDVALPSNFPHLSVSKSFVTDTRVCALYADGSVSACYSPGLLWATGIKQQLFVSHGGLQHLTETFLRKTGSGKKVRGKINCQEVFQYFPMHVVTALLGDPVNWLIGF